MKPFLVAPLAAALLSLGPLACKTRGFNATQKSQARGAGLSRLEIVPGRNRTYWHAPSDAEMEAYLSQTILAATPSGSAVSVSPLSKDHPLARRLQMWADAMDGRLRETQWGRRMMTHVPRPRIYVWPADVLNAFNIGAGVLYPGNVSVGGAGATAPTQEPHVSLATLTKGAVAEPPFGPLGGVPLKAAPNLASEIVSRWNPFLRGILPGCAGEAVFGKVSFRGCADPAQTIQSGAIASTVTLNAVVFFSKFLDSLSEAHAVATLAHELGHYYRAHSSDTLRGKVNFYYNDDDERNPIGAPRRPLDEKGIADSRAIAEALAVLRPNDGALDREAYASESLAHIARTEISRGAFNDLFDEMIKKGTELQARHESKDIDDATYLKGLGELYKPLSGHAYIEKKCSLHPGLACGPLASASAAPAFLSALATPFSGWTRPQQDAFLAWQRALAAVAPRIPATVTPSANWSDAVLSWDKLVSKESGSGGAQDALNALVEPDGTYKTLPLHDLLASLRAHENRWAQAIGRMRDELAARKLGWYTVEQEADEVSLELLSLVGVHPETAIDLQLAMLRINEVAAGPNAATLGHDACDRLRKDGFKAVARQSFYVSPGDWHDAHHSSCYRAFNLHRTLRTETFAPRSASIPFLAEPEYRALLKGVTEQAYAVAGKSPQGTGTIVTQGMRLTKALRGENASGAPSRSRSRSR